MIRVALIGGVAVLLVGCATIAEPAVRGAGTCQETGTDELLGREATSAIGAAILARTTAERLRWINRDTLVTADYRTDRVNVQLDDANRITEIKCG